MAVDCRDQRSGQTRGSVAGGRRQCGSDFGDDDIGQFGALGGELVGQRFIGRQPVIVNRGPDIRIVATATAPSSASTMPPALIERWWALSASDLMAQNLQLTGVGGLRPQDATHVASALVWSVSVFQTFDGPVSKLDNILTCKDGQQLRIMKPVMTSQRRICLRRCKLDDSNLSSTSSRKPRAT